MPWDEMGRFLAPLAAAVVIFAAAWAVAYFMLHSTFVSSANEARIAALESEQKKLSRATVENEFRLRVSKSTLTEHGLSFF